MKELNFPIPCFKECVPAEQVISIGDDVYLSNCLNLNELKRLQKSCRTDVFEAIYCRSDSFRCRINAEEYNVSEGMMLMKLPDNSISFSDGNGKETELIIIMASAQFFSNHRLDIIKMSNEVIGAFNNPCFKLLPEECALFEQHIGLLSEIARSDYAYAKGSAYHLIASVFCLLGSSVSRQVINQGIEFQSVSARNKLIFDRFLDLVKQYHTEQRNVIFYANKLCISPKYLSKIVKSVSGFSAPQWIDRFVVRQAQQLLKNSDSCIKEISEELNFPCPSFFYKYFKQHTGMTPKQYRES